MPSEFDDDEFSFTPAPYNQGLWAMSLADLLSILLTFFVMLYAYSYVNAQKSQSAVKGVKGTFSKDQQSESMSGLEQSTLGTEPLEQYYTETKKFALEALQIDEVRITQEGTKLIMRLPAELLFGAGNAEIDDRKLFLARMADGLSEHPVGRQLDVEFLIGRDSPVSGQALPLSVLRAGAFARTMASMGVPEEKIFTGISESDPAFFVLTFYPRDDTRSGLAF